MSGARGAAVLSVDGKSVPLCLTLGGLAELEHTFGCASLSDLQLRLKNLTAHELTTVIEILLKGSGAQCSVPDLSPGDAARAVAEAFRAALG